MPHTSAICCTISKCKWMFLSIYFTNFIHFRTKFMKDRHENNHNYLLIIHGIFKQQLFQFCIGQLTHIPNKISIFSLVYHQIKTLRWKLYLCRKKNDKWWQNDGKNKTKISRNLKIIIVNVFHFSFLFLLSFIHDHCAHFIVFVGLHTVDQRKCWTPHLFRLLDLSESGH